MTEGKSPTSPAGASHRVLLDTFLHNLVRSRLFEYFTLRDAGLLPDLRRLCLARSAGTRLNPRRLTPLNRLYAQAFKFLQQTDGLFPLTIPWLDAAWEWARRGEISSGKKLLRLAESAGQPYRADAILPMPELTPSVSYSQTGLVGGDPRWLEILSQALLAARFDFPVLLTGETGVGKEMVARAIHAHSRRAQENCVFVNCGGIPESLAASEFFGFRGGSFTGADSRDRKGWLETAHRGTLILDEITELPLETQPLLLRALQNGEAQKIGGGSIKVDIRLIAISNRSVEDEVAAGRFRRDLYYRVAVIPLHIPSLRERPEDIPLLANYFLDQYRQNNPDLKSSGFSREAMQALLRYPWPGNVRELQNVVARALVICRQTEISRQHLVFDISCKSPDPFNEEVFRCLDELGEVNGQIEKPYLVEFLREKGEGFSSGDYARRFEVSESTARRHLKALLQNGVIASQGAGKARRFRLRRHSNDD